jgi:hypothetical protein
MWIDIWAGFVVCVSIGMPIYFVLEMKRIDKLPVELDDHEDKISEI